MEECKTGSLTPVSSAMIPPSSTANNSGSSVTMYSPLDLRGAGSGHVLSGSAGGICDDDDSDCTADINVDSDDDIHLHVSPTQQSPTGKN